MAVRSKSVSFRLDGGESSSRWVTTADMIRDSRILSSMIPERVSAVVGVARSGLAAASVVAMEHHLPLWSVSLDTESVIPLGGGVRAGNMKPRRGKVVVVDDTVASGGTMAAIHGKLQAAFGDYQRAAVYCTPEMTRHVDLYAVELPGPHYLEWNFFNSIYAQSLAVDFDGVLCEDCPPEVDDDGKGYRNWMIGAKPLHLPKRYPVTVVTSRLEKYRPYSFNWLCRWGVTINELHMGPWKTKHERWMAYSDNRCGHKADAFAQSGAELFVESCPIQAAEIARRTGKRVICPAAAKVFN